MWFFPKIFLDYTNKTTSVKDRALAPWGEQAITQTDVKILLT